MAADDLATQVARASAAMVFIIYLLFFSSHGIDLLLQGYSSLSNRRVNPLCPESTWDINLYMDTPALATGGLTLYVLNQPET